MNADRFIATLERELAELADKQLARNPLLEGLREAVAAARAAAESGWTGRSVVIGHGHTRHGQRGRVVQELPDDLLVVRIQVGGKHPTADILVPAAMVLPEDTPTEPASRETVEMLYARQRAAARQTPPEGTPT